MKIHFLCLVAAVVTSSMIGCSSTPTDSSQTFVNTPSGASSDDAGGSGGGNSSSGKGSSSGSGSSGGTTSSSNGGSSSGGSGTSSSSSSGGSSGSSSGGSGSTSSSSGGTASDAGAPQSARGCGQATTCTPAPDLAPPAATDGFQIALPANSITIQPGEEAYYCYYKNIPGTATVNVGAFQSWMTQGASHHFILFTGAGADGTISGGALVGNGGGCVPQGTWLYATSTSGQIIELKMPDGVGLPLSAGQTLIFNNHFINTGSAAVSPAVKLNVLFAQNVTAQAGAMVSFNAGIAVPPGGTQDVTGTCSPPAGSKFFAYTTHVHRHGGSASTGAYTDVNFVSGGKTTNIVHSTDWESPDVGLWGPPNYLTVNSGDHFAYDCHFVNQDSAVVTFGETAATGEMCMSIGYYFPAGSPTVGTSNPYCN